MNNINAKEFKKNPDLLKVVVPDTDLKNMLVEYVGESLDPEDKLVTVEMIVETVAREFPQFIFAVAEENYFRGYEQAMDDLTRDINRVEQLSGKIKKIENEKRKSCKLCEE